MLPQLPQTEALAYAGKINLSLLNDIFAFVYETSDADAALKQDARQRCIFFDGQSSSAALQSKYGFLYLGELLERYESRYEASIQDFRAIALALGYTCGLTMDSMFVGTQRSDFIRRLKRRANGDIYLTGALYLLSEVQSGRVSLEAALMGPHKTTEDLIFALSLLKGSAQAFQQCRSQLLHLLGAGRTMPVLGNMKSLAWLITWLGHRIKGLRGRDLTLFRALAALSVSFVKTGSRHHDVLQEHGYSPLEIAYANMMAVFSQMDRDALDPGSITAQKIAAELFYKVFGHEKPLAPEVYEQLSRIFARYRVLRPRCHGCDQLADVLKEAPKISNAETAFWFLSQLNVSACHPAFDAFDVLDSRWDALASLMDKQSYLRFFEISLNEEMDKTEIQSRIERYNALTGEDYLAKFWEGGSRLSFRLLAKKELLDLWQLFQASLDQDGTIIRYDMMDHIRDTLDGISILQAYRFCETFFKVYGIDGLARFFTDKGRFFFRSLAEYGSSYSCGGSPIRFVLKLGRAFLDENGRYQLLCWLEEYIFAYEQSWYLPFATAVLWDESVAALFSKEEQTALFKIVIRQPDLPQSVESTLKKRYMAAEELQKEKDAQKAAEQEKAQRYRQARKEELQQLYSQKTDGSFSSVRKFLEQHRYPRESLELAGQVAYEDLHMRAPESGQSWNRNETVSLLAVCEVFMKLGCMQLQELQTWIAQIQMKEGEACEHSED